MLISHILQTIAILTPLALAQPTAQQLQPNQSTHGTLTFNYSLNITRVTINNPPINLYDNNLATDLESFMLTLQDPKHPKVVIFKSADPEIFASHLDLNALLLPTLNTHLLQQLQTTTSLLRNTTTTVFISQINGLATGFGNEFLLQTDIRFAGPKARASQLENAAGLFAGAGGQQALPRLVNRGRGLQYLLASLAVDGPTGAKLGWFNEYFDDEPTLEKAVDALATRIALFPAQAIQATKGGLLELFPGPDVYVRDSEGLARLAVEPDEQAVVRRMLELGGNQSRSAFELGLPDTLLQLWV